MKLSQDELWTPSPQLLSAYADGELAGTPALANMHRRITLWLAEHPHEAAELELQRELSRLMLVTRPPRPTPSVWAEVWARVLRTRPVAMRPQYLPWLVGLAAVLMLIILGGGFFRSDAPSVNLTQDVMQSAKIRHGEAAPAVLKAMKFVTADDIEIIHIAGPDVATLIIGRLPLADTMALVQTHEIEFSPSCDAEPKTELRTCGNRTPLVWTPLPSECKGAGKLEGCPR